MNDDTITLNNSPEKLEQWKQLRETEQMYFLTCLMLEQREYVGDTVITAARVIEFNRAIHKKIKEDREALQAELQIDSSGNTIQKQPFEFDMAGIDNV